MATKTAPPTIGSTSTAPTVATVASAPAEPLSSPLKVTSITRVFGPTAATRPPNNPSAHRFIAGCPVPLSVVCEWSVDAGDEFPNLGAQSWPFWPMLWRRPTAETRLPAEMELVTAQRQYDTAVLRLQAAGYVVQD